MTSKQQIPSGFRDEEELEDYLSQPSPELIASLGQLDGDLLILGVGGKMGPTLARQAKRALVEAGRSSRVIGVSRFSRPESRSRLENHGVETVCCDLLDPDEVARLPRVPNVIFLVGTKFGTTGSEAKTWAVNTITPANVCRHFPDSRMVALSTGNVYPLTPVESGGPRETDPTGPIGEYAQSALGRERVFEFFSIEGGVPIVLIRLNYAIDLRYGVLLDIAEKIRSGKPIDLTMGFFNIIWQGEANERILRSLEHASSPPEILNLTGDTIVSVREVAERMGKLMETPPIFSGEEASTALLSNAAKSIERFGSPRIRTGQMIEWTVEWVKRGGKTLGKPTHFETRDGRF